MTKVKISIIIPIYNKKKYLAECLESVEYQDMAKQTEVLMIDDGSSDGSGEVCRRFLNRNEKWYYFYQENQGLGNARNFGISMSVGEYILFLDADDKLSDDCIWQLINYIGEEEKDLIYFDAYECDEDLKCIKVRKSYPYNFANIDKELAIRNCFQPSMVWLRLYNSSLVKKHHFKNIWFEDMEFFPKILLDSKKIEYINIPIYYYRRNRDSITAMINDIRNEGVIYAWRSTYNYYFGKKEIVDFEIALTKSMATFICRRPCIIIDLLCFYHEWRQIKKNNAKHVYIVIDGEQIKYIEDQKEHIEKDDVWECVKNAIENSYYIKIYK